MLLERRDNPQFNVALRTFITVEDTPGSTNYSQFLSSMHGKFFCFEARRCAGRVADRKFSINSFFSRLFNSLSLHRKYGGISDPSTIAMLCNQT